VIYSPDITYYSKQPTLIEFKHLSRAAFTLTKTLAALVRHITD